MATVREATAYFTERMKALTAEELTIGGQLEELSGGIGRCPGPGEREGLETYRGNPGGYSCSGCLYRNLYLELLC